MSLPAPDRYIDLMWRLNRDGAEGIILGCTEIPLVLPVDAAAAEGILAVDAGEALVQRLVRAWREVRE